MSKLPAPHIRTEARSRYMLTDVLLTAVVLSLCFFHGKIVGTREGTVLAALLTGTTVKLFTRPLKAPLERFLKR